MSWEADAIALLHRIASWEEGPEVTSSFDAPGPAKEAREVLAGIGIFGPPVIEPTPPLSELQDKLARVRTLPQLWSERYSDTTRRSARQASLECARDLRKALDG